MILPILQDVGNFLRGLKRELPEVFRVLPPCRRPPPKKQNQREVARRALSERAVVWSQKMGVRFNTLRIKDQKTLWGSCSHHGNLNFNWRLVLAPPEIQDYLVIHELAHLLEMNHSRRFWKHVSVWCPDHRARRRWLREHGPGLKQAKA